MYVFLPETLRNYCNAYQPVVWPRFWLPFPIPFFKLLKYNIVSIKPMSCTKCIALCWMVAAKCTWRRIMPDIMNGRMAWGGSQEQQQHDHDQPYPEHGLSAGRGESNMNSNKSSSTSPCTSSTISSSYCCWQEVKPIPNRREWLPAVSRYEQKGWDEGRQTMLSCWRPIRRGCCSGVTR